MSRVVLLSALVVLSAAPMARADTAGDLLALMQVPGVSGHEDRVRELIELGMPTWARLRADDLGNVLLRIGSLGPHTLIVAPLDEGGLVVSGITDEGYLRVHRHTSAPGVRLAAQFLVGQPVQVIKADGSPVAGVIAASSTHLRAFADAADVARVKGLDDIWIDVGASARADVEKLGIRMLDSVTVRDRAALMGRQVAGVAASPRAAALALAQLVQRLPGRPDISGRQVSLAWMTQSQYGNRGLLRLLETLKPDRVILLRATPAPVEDARGAVGQLGGGPIVSVDDDVLKAAAMRAGVATQTLPAARTRMALPQEWKGTAVSTVSVPALFAQTPVETVDARDVESLATLLAAIAEFPNLAEAKASALRTTSGLDATRTEGQGSPRTEGQGFPALSEVEGSPGRSPADPALQMLSTLIETDGVSGHEGPVRDAILKLLPSWAKPEVDARGNVLVRFGSGGKSLFFVAHMDEVGFQIAGIGDDGSATVAARGGMYLSLYEAHPVTVRTPAGPVTAVLAPRLDYTSATTSQPTIEQLRLYFGTTSAAETAALGIAAGQSATIRKAFARLGDERATGRAMDDRNGCTALLLALQQIDPSKVTNRVTFAWTVEEETGLVGAEAIATTRGVDPDTVFAIDTFVSSDTPVDNDRLAAARLGAGAVLRGIDSRTLVRPAVMDRIVGIAKDAGVPLQIGVTSGGTDASVLSARGAIDVGLSWPGRYSHSPVEVMDRRDLLALVKLIAALASAY